MLVLSYSIKIKESIIPFAYHGLIALVMCLIYIISSSRDLYSRVLASVGNPHRGQNSSQSLFIVEFFDILEIFRSLKRKNSMNCHSFGFGKHNFIAWDVTNHFQLSTSSPHIVVLDMTSWAPQLCYLAGALLINANIILCWYRIGDPNSLKKAW